MAAPQGNPYIYGLHYWSGATDLFGGSVGGGVAKPGWVVEFGFAPDLTTGNPPQPNTSNPAVQGVQQASSHGLTPVLRIDADQNNTILQTTNPGYGTYKQQVLNAIGALRAAPYNVHRFILGNEPNLAGITPDQYAAVYNDIHSAVAAQYSDVELLVAAVAPWNGGGNPSCNPYGADPHGTVQTWKNYFHSLLEQLNTADGFAIHAYGQHSWSWTNDPRADGERGFQIYKWWIKEIDTYWQAPKDFANKPIYLTELNTAANGNFTAMPPCNSNSPAGSYQAYWINKAYEELDMWNRYHAHRLQCACWFVGQNGRGWDCFSLEYTSWNMPTARSNWVAMVNSTTYRNDYQSALGLVYDLDTGQSNLSSSDPNQIVLGLYRGTFTWLGQYTDWGSGGPLPGLSDNWVILHFQRFWVGSEGTYNFATTSDDGSWLWIDGEIVVNNSGQHGPQRIQGSKYLKPGIHIAAFKMFEASGGATAGYEYQPPGSSWQTFPHSVYSGMAQAWKLDTVNSNLSSNDWTQIKPAAWIYDFRWEGGPTVGYYSGGEQTQDWSGGPDNQPDDFIIDHARYFFAPNDGSYNFHLRSDDGSWLWVDGRIVVNNYGLHAAQDATGGQFLRQGWHLLHFKMFERGGGAQLWMEWEPPGQLNGQSGYWDICAYTDAAPCGKPRYEWPSPCSCT